MEKYADFVTKELVAALTKGEIEECTVDQPPEFINGLRVVDDKLPKLRLCINPMYINLHLPYDRVRYEWLQDMVGLGGYGSSR